MGVDIAGVATLSSPGTTLAVDGASRWMNVNASGILTRPQSPFMRGQFVGKGTPYNAGGAALLVTADVNVGNCWNNANGYWTCPVAGYYMATLGAIASANSGYPQFLKNGGVLHTNHWNHSGSWHYVTMSAIVYCEAGDNFCWVIASPSPATAGFYAEGGHGMFSFALMA